MGEKYYTVSGWLMASAYLVFSFLVRFWSINSKIEGRSQKAKMNGFNGYQTKPKVTFEDQVVQKKTPVVTSQTTLPNPPEDEAQISDSESDSESSASETDRSEAEVDQVVAPQAEDNLILTPDMADLILSYLDQMNIRTVHCECTTTHLLKGDIAGAQARLDEAKRMLDEIPRTMSHTERKVYMIEISQYVHSIFATLEKLSIKLIKCHGDTICDIIQEFNANIKKIEEEVAQKKPLKKVIGVDRETALRGLEIGVLCAFFALTVFVAFVLTRPDIATAFGGLVLRLVNNTWNFTLKTRPNVSMMSNSSGLGFLANLETM